MILPSLQDTSLPRHPKGVRAIRSLRFVLPAVIIAAAILVASAPVEAAPSRKMALGVSQVAGSRSIQAVHDFANSVGGQYPASWTIWSQWGNPATKGFPTDMVAKLKAVGVKPMIWWEPMTTVGSCSFAKLRLIAKGRYDKYIKSWARAAKASRTTIMLRFAHEMNGRYFPWGVGNCGNTRQHFLAAWNRVYNLVRNKVGAKNVKFLWTVATQSCRGCNAYKPWFPGKTKVQKIGFSTFNWGSQKKWKTMADGFPVIMKKMAEFTGKQVIVTEVASNRHGGPCNCIHDKPNWIRDGYRAVYNKYPKVKGMTWLNVNLKSAGHPDWSLNDPSPGSKQAYAEILSQPKFQGRY